MLSPKARTVSHSLVVVLSNNAELSESLSTGCFRDIIQREAQREESIRPEWEGSQKLPGSIGNAELTPIATFRFGPGQGESCLARPRPRGFALILRRSLAWPAIVLMWQ